MARGELDRSVEQFVLRWFFDEGIKKLLMQKVSKLNLHFSSCFELALILLVSTPAILTPSLSLPLSSNHIAFVVDVFLAVILRFF